MQLPTLCLLDGSNSSAAVPSAGAVLQKLSSTLVSFNTVLAISSIEKWLVSMNGIPRSLYSASIANGRESAIKFSRPHPEDGQTVPQ